MDISKVNIRFNTFETNSSSAHTVVMTNSDTRVSQEEIQNYILQELNYGENTEIINDKKYISLSLVSDSFYGRGFSVNQSWIEKLNYIIASLRDLNKISKLINSILEIANVPECAGVNFRVSDGLFKIIESNLRFENKIKPDRLSRVLSDIFGTIDHQSMNLINECIDAMSKINEFKDMSSDEKILEIILNNKFIIVEDSDEENVITELVRDTIIDCDYVKYILSFNYDDNTGKFIELSDYITEDYDLEDDF